MPVKLVWTPQRDTRLKQMRSERAGWDSIADMLGISRNAAIERGRRIGARLPPPEHMLPPDDPDRPPLPAGHPVSWQVLVEHTSLAGQPYASSEASVCRLETRSAPETCRAPPFCFEPP